MIIPCGIPAEVGGLEGDNGPGHGAVVLEEVLGEDGGLDGEGDPLDDPLGLCNNVEALV